MIAGQDVLRRLYEDRLRACGGELGLRRPTTTAPRTHPGLSVIVVLAAFDPRTVVAGALGFAAGLTAEAAAPWMRAYTRTVFLAGNPGNLARQVDFAHTSVDGRAAWVAPHEPDAHYGLRRVLRAFTGTSALQLPPTLEVPVPGGAPTGLTYELSLPVAATVHSYLVDVHHTVTEAYLRGLLRPGDRLRLRQVRDLAALGGQPAYARVLPYPDDDGVLRPLTWLARSGATR